MFKDLVVIKLYIGKQNVKKKKTKLLWYTQRTSFTKDEFEIKLKQK